jgi:predicted MPP superfamily phosphohydrolase
MSLLSGLITLTASCAGHAEWWIQLVNRSHAFPVPHQTLRKVRYCHDAAVLLYPFVLLWLAGFGPAGLLTGGTLAQQSYAVKWLLGLTIPGIIPLAGGMLRWQFQHHRLFHQADSVQIYDLKKLSQDQAVKNQTIQNRPTESPVIQGDLEGPRRSILRIVPGNQMFHLEINHKTVPIRRKVTPSGNKQIPLRIVHFSDLHFVGCPGEAYYRWAFQQARELRGDAYVFTGDLIDVPDLIPMAVDILGGLTESAPCFFVLGNHDWRHDYQAVRRMLVQKGWIDLGSRSTICQLRNRSVLLAGSEYPWIGKQIPEPAAGAADLKILLSHSPDQLHIARRLGFDLMLSGHTHGGQVVLPLLGPVYAPSLYGVKYASGLFPSGNLTLHVSRGLGAKDGLRLNCRPELTCLHVHS